MYSLISSFQPRASCSETTFLMTATPRLCKQRENGRRREWFFISENSRVGIIDEPEAVMRFISEGRVVRRRDQEDRRAAS